MVSPSQTQTTIVEEKAEQAISSGSQLHQPNPSVTPNPSANPNLLTATNARHEPSRPPSLSPFADPIEPITPLSSSFASIAIERRQQGSANGGLPKQRYFHSRRLQNKEDIPKPWLAKKDPREKWVTIIPLIGIFLGLCIAAFLVYNGITSVVNHKYCEVLMEDFSRGWRDDIWTREVEVGGFGNGQFEYSTASTENSYIGSDGHLHIRPTLTDESLIVNDNIMNLTALGICTSKIRTSCEIRTNRTAGIIVNPVRSARINTKKSASIRYGRVEVTAKLPAGKWLWPGIWMLPVKETYGPWPASGEIDIAESRGNSYTDVQGGNDIMTSALHWGPDYANDAWWRTNSRRRALHTTYSDGFHTFGLEWSQDYLFTYVDSRLLQVMYVAFQDQGGLWNRGYFPLKSENGTRYIDPWSQTGRKSTPFDQDFYLILNVGVGATNGYFQNGIDGKPWVDGSPSAMKDFWGARNDWYPTWKNGGEMVVKSVKMWKQCD